MENSNLFDDQNLLNENGKNDLYEAAKWAKFLGIIGLIFITLLVLAGVFAGSILATAMSEAGGGAAFSGAAFTIVYIIMAALYFYPVWTFFKFGNLMRAAIRANNSNMFTEALSNLKNCFKFMAMLTIIMIALYVLIIVFMGIGSAFM